MNKAKYPVLIVFSLFLVTSCAKRVEPGASEAEAGQQVPPPPQPRRAPVETDIFIAWDTPPEVIKRVPPVYPAKAKEDSVKGYVVLKIVVDESGNVVATEVMESDPPGVFEEAAVTAIKQWRFKPATQRNYPIKVMLAQKVEFALGKRN